MECPDCGKPRLFNFFLRWKSNGTIVARISPSYRMVLVESTLMEDIYQRIEAVLGAPIRQAIFEAERAATFATVDSLLPAWLIKWVMRNRLVMHPTSRFLQLLARTAGMADVHTVYYHVFRGSLARVRNEFNRDLFAAVVVGAFERMEGLIHDHAWIELGGELHLLIVPAREKPEIAERLKPQIVAPLPGKRRIELCQRCGFPTALEHLRWDLPNALITDERRGVRMSFVDDYAFSAVFRELIAEFGEEIESIIVEASAEYTLRSIEETGFFSARRSREEMYDDFLELLPVYGHGNPVERKVSEGALEVTIENPYSTHLLSGQLVAVFELVEEKTGSVFIDESDPSRLRVTIKA